MSVTPPPLPATQAMRPSEGVQRLPWLDAVRGVALAGIGLMNVEWFTRPFEELGMGPTADMHGAERMLSWAVMALVQGKFWVLFALLFGIGFTLQQDRLRQAGIIPTALLLRRLGVLFAIGVAHAVLLWPGDILHTYAVAGALLLLWPAMAPRVQALLGVTLYAGVALLLLAGGVMLLTADPHAEWWEPMQTNAAAAATVYATGTYAEVTLQRLRDGMDMLSYEVLLLPMALATFLLGRALLQSGWLPTGADVNRAGANRAVVNQAGSVWPWGTGLAGVFLTALGMWVAIRAGNDVNRIIISSAIVTLGALPLALCYLAVLRWLWSTAAGRLVLKPFGGLGRMALTHYLGQSLLLSCLFYGYGLGWWGQIGRGGQLLIVLVIVAVQMAISALWLLWFRHGPIEWLWRWATYGRRPPLLRARSSSRAAA